MAGKPEKQNLTERLEMEQLGAGAFAGGGYEDVKTYPYISPSYRLPFAHIGTDKQLFLDNYMLDHFIDVKRVLEQPEKHPEPIIQNDGLPWETTGFSPAVIAAFRDEEDGKYKLWYINYTANDVYGFTGPGLCYMESDDAFHWTKPMLDVCVPFGGHRKTNIVMNDVIPVSLVQNVDRSVHNYKFLFAYRSSSEAKKLGKSVITNVAGSNDGLRWTTIEQDIKQRLYHTSGAVWDDRIGEWIAYGQHSHHWHHGPRTRQGGRQHSKDFIHWSPREVVISADWEPDMEPSREIHDMSIRKIGGLYIGITGEAYTEPIWCANETGANWRDIFFQNLGLYSSRDGIRFHRVGGAGPWADNGEPGSRDYGFLSGSTAGLMYSGGKMLFLHLSIPSKQHWYHIDTMPTLVQMDRFKRDQDEWDYRCAVTGMPVPPMLEGRTACALTMREDGFAALKPVYEQGQVYTKQFVFEGDRLRINAKCGFGFIKAELLDPWFKPYEGFAADDCVPVHDKTDAVWHTVSWKNGADVSALWNKPVRIRFHIREAALYGFQFIYQDGRG